MLRLTLTLVTITILFTLCSLSDAAEIKWKLDDQGRKVFYNIPSKPAIDIAVPLTRFELYEKRKRDFDAIIDAACSRHGIEPSLVRAMIHVESNWNTAAISPAGAMGLMQLMPDTAKRFGVTKIFDPAQNIEGGVKYLKFLIGTFDDDMSLVVAAYNAGEGAVRKFNGVPRYNETQNYVRNVLALYNYDTEHQTS